MEEPATTVPRSIPRQRPFITPVAVLTIQVAAVITRRRLGTTHRQRGITSRRRVITLSPGCINRRRVITHHRVITGPTRIKGGTVNIEVAGTTTTEVVDVTTNTAGAAIKTVKAIKTAKATTAAEAATVNPGQAQCMWERACSRLQNVSQLSAE